MIVKQIVHIVSAYAAQVGLSAKEKHNFWESFVIVKFLSKISFSLVATKW